MMNHLFLSLLVKDVQIGDIVSQLLGEAVSRNLGQGSSHVQLCLFHLVKCLYKHTEIGQYEFWIY